MTFIISLVHLTRLSVHLQASAISTFLSRFIPIISSTHSLFSLAPELQLVTFIFGLLTGVCVRLFHFEFIPVLSRAPQTCSGVSSSPSELVAAAASARWLVSLGLFCLQRLVFVVQAILWRAFPGASYLRELDPAAS